MTHRFPIKEIARQAGLGTATVDRAINKRSHVSPQTRARVAAAISELQGQEAQLAARGRRMFFDFVIEAPNRFSLEVRRVAESILPEISGAVCRPRFLFQEVMQEDEVTAALARIAKRGSQGVCLKARDLASIRNSIDALHAANIPVVTLVTDVSDCARIAYVGLDNQSAGQTAAYLVAFATQGKTGSVLTTKSQSSFLGEEERECAFVRALEIRRPELKVIDVSGGSGLTYETSKRVAGALEKISDLRAVYSMGGGNRAVLQQLQEHCLTPDIYVAHDLDQENSDLLKTRQLDFVLHHDLRSDVKNAFIALLQHHGLSAAKTEISPSNIQIITPENLLQSEK